MAATFLVATALDAAGPRSEKAALEAIAPPAPLGVFEAADGRIVVPVGGALKVIDPDDPSTVEGLALSDEFELPANGVLMPVGWSADGTKLALSSERTGDRYVLSSDGAVTHVAGGGGCCWFVESPWLSSDGTTTIHVVGGEWLRLDGLAGGSRSIELQPPMGDLDTGAVPVTALSPDSTRIAYTAYQPEDTDMLPSVHVIDVASGGARRVVLPGFGHIRQMAWSPDGSRLLLIAGPWRQSTTATMLNPIVGPRETGLYTVDLHGDPMDPAASPAPIASGHFLAAAWSPDGARVAAIDFAPSGRRLVVMNADGSARRVLVDLPQSDLFTGLAWHPGSGSDAR